MALATRPRLLLLDEPMAGMGADESQHMIGLLASLKRHQTIVLVEHDMDAVFRLADRISVLVYGASSPAVRPKDKNESGGAKSIPGRGRLMLEVRDLQTAYGRSQVLFGISLSVGEGQCNPAGTQRHGQDHYRALDHGNHPAAGRKDSVEK